MQKKKVQIALLTAFALVAFAANSVLNRLALGANTIDAGSFITIRLVSGAITLALINGINNNANERNIPLHYRLWNLLPNIYFPIIRSIISVLVSTRTAQIVL